MTTEDARRLWLPTYEFVEASLLHYQPNTPEIADDVALDPFPVPQAVPGDIVRDDDDRISALSKGCVVQQELESFATAHRSDRNTQLHFGQLLMHSCEGNPRLRDMKNVIRRVQRLASSDSGKLSERAHKATMMAPLPPNFPGAAKSAWQLFCADFKRQRKEDEQEGRIEAVMAMDTAVESASGSRSDRRKCLSCDCPLDQNEGGLICAECNELIDAGNDNDDNGDGDDECESSSSSSSSSDVEMRPLKANEAWAAFKKENMGAGPYADLAAESSAARGAAWERALLEYHAEEVVPPWSLEEADITKLEANLLAKKKSKRNPTVAAGAIAAAAAAEGLIAKRQKKVDNGTAGRCTCSSMCKTKLCPCKAAGVFCGIECHPTRHAKAPACNNKEHGKSSDDVEDEMLDT